MIKINSQFFLLLCISCTSILLAQTTALRNVQWGMTKNEVLKAERRNAITFNDQGKIVEQITGLDGITGKTELFGLSIELNYYFKNSHLVMAIISFNINQPYQSSEMIGQIILKNLISNYGTYEQNESLYRWETGSTIITFEFPGEWTTSANINYNPKEKLDFKSDEF